MPGTTYKIKFGRNEKALVVSDIHLRLPITPELAMIQKSLAERVDKLNKHKVATLILNGDIFELWEKPVQDVEDIILGFEALTKSIEKFASKKSHRVVFTVGNHDEAINTNSSYKKALQKLWGAKVCNSIDLSLEGQKVRIEHGHEFDPYNQTTTEAGKTHGKSLVQSTLPRLVKAIPLVFSGIGDVVNRAELPCYAISRLMYKIVVPIVLPLSLAASIYFLYSTGDIRWLWAFCLVWLAVWALVIVLDWVLESIADLTFGGGSKYLKKLDEYQKQKGFDLLVLGHTHLGGVWKREGYSYANSGCNDVIVKSRYGYLGIYKFPRFVQMSGINLDGSKKDLAKYEEKIVSLVK